jgi:hypothetical protein
MMRAAALNFLFIVTFAVCFANVAHAQDNQSQPQSLGDVARQARAAKASTPKSATVLDDDNLPKSKGGAGGSAAGGGKLSGDKQAFCDEVRQRKDPTAEQICAALAIDMGSEYENMTARYVTLAKSVCAANGGHLPSSDPKDPSLAAQYRELNEISAKFSGMLQAEIKTFHDSEVAVNSVPQEELDELTAKVPDWRDATALSANPEENRRFHEIAEKYKSRQKERQEASAQQRARSFRYICDAARLQDLCDHH